ncbi:MAG TPA: anti-sigma factor RsbA family regulatory protein [Jatrophihabitans sp.]|nr:anti-sigma factor RsbA family regulatory protein [Jatrophihabitans sp.]
MSPVKHEALAYDGAEAFAPLCRTLTAEALAADRPVLLLMAGDRLAAVADELGPDQHEVTFVPTDVAGRNPARITALLDGFRGASPLRRGLALTDWGLAGRSPAVLAETEFAESLLNVAGDPWAIELGCLYDAATLPEPVLAGMRRAHPSVRGETGNADFRPGLAADLFATDLVAAPDELTVRPFGPAGLSAARAAVRAFADGAGLPAARAEDLVLAANEIVTNSIRHGGGTAHLTLWQQDGSVLCQVTDTGRMSDPMAGRRLPSPSAGSGRGLWLANQLCDLVQVRSSAAGTVVRLLVDRL